MPAHVCGLVLAFEPLKAAGGQKSWEDHSGRSTRLQKRKLESNETLAASAMRDPNIASRKPDEAVRIRDHEKDRNAWTERVNGLLF